jgi:glucosamine--fructose-6-phosphate aminotransferase (isomerizing)
LEKNTVLLVLSQSGETADTLAALREAKRRGHRALAIVNVVGSTIARESDGGIYMHAGPEIGVASTKAFVSTLTILALLAVHLGRLRNLSARRALEILHALEAVPKQLESILAQNSALKKLAKKYAKADDFFFLSRGYNFPIALEGALKLKEISYIHAEGYAAGELKHGPIALIDENMPIVVIAPHDGVFEKTVSNMQEVAARGGNIILMTDAKGAAEATVESMVTIVLPDMASIFTPIVYAVPVQLLAYHTAVVMGTDVDQPRNLAKSVTVE